MLNLQPWMRTGQSSAVNYSHDIAGEVQKLNQAGSFSLSPNLLSLIG
jgi:hypothetical protein